MSIAVHELLIAEPPLAVRYGLPARQVGFALCEDERGRRITLLADPDYLILLSSALGAAVTGPIELATHRFERRSGWPQDWAPDA